MRRSPLLPALALLVLAAALAAPAPAQSLEEILAQHYEAVGGKERIQAVKSVRLTGRQIAGPQEMPLTVQWLRPNRIRVEFTFQGMTGIQAYDGTTAWMVMPFLGKVDPEPMTGDDLKDILDQSDLVEGPLVDWQAKGHKVALAGKESIEGTEAWRLEVDKANGEHVTVWLDAEAMLEIKHASKRKRGEQEVEFESSFGDYKEVGGLMLAHAVESRPKGAPQGFSLVLDKIEIDAEVDPAVFTMPAKAATPAAG
jgi:hypothetical protein